MFGSRPFRHAALAAGAGALLLGATGARAETLTQALVQAYQNNPRVLAARDALRAIDEQVAQALSLFRPRVSANFSAGYSTSKTCRTGSAGCTPRFPGDTLPRGSTNTPVSASIELRQPIFQGGTEYAELRRAEATIRAGRARLNTTEQDIFFQVITAYMNVVRDEALVRLNRNNVMVLQRQLQAVRDRFNVGEVTRTDVAQSEASVAQAQAQLELTIGSLEGSRANYISLVGRRPINLVQPRQPILPSRLEVALGIAKTTNPTIIAATYDEFAARHTVRSITGELLPQVFVNGALSRDYDVGAMPNTRSDSASVALTLTVPLYQSGSVYSRVRAAKQTVYQRGNDLAQARRNVEQATTVAWYALQSARAAVRAFESESRANAVALEGVRQENQAGLRTVLDVLQQEQRLRDSQANLVRARADVIVASYQLIQAMGRLTAVDLHLPVPIYDATAYYRAIKWLPAGTGPSMGLPPPDPGLHGPPVPPPPNAGLTSSTAPGRRLLPPPRRRAK